METNHASGSAFVYGPVSQTNELSLNINKTTHKIVIPLHFRHNHSHDKQPPPISDAHRIIIWLKYGVDDTKVTDFFATTGQILLD